MDSDAVQGRGRQCSGNDPDADFAGPLLAYCFCQFMQGCAAGHDIVQKGNMLTLEASGAGKSMAHVAVPFFPRQCRLRGRVLVADTCMGQQRNAHTSGELTANFRSLIKSPFFQLVRVQRHRNDAIGQGKGTEFGEQQIG